MASGLELAKAAAAEPYCGMLGIRLEHADKDGAKIVLPFREEISNPGKQVHGGVVSSLLGIAARIGALAGIDMPGPPLSNTAELHAAYLSSAVGEDMTGEARVLRRGKELAHVRADVTSSTGKPIATGTAIFRAVPGPENTAGSAANPPFAVETHDIPSLARMLTAAAFIAKLDINLDYYYQGRARLKMPFRADLADDTGTIHEGALGALIDTSGAMAAWSLIKPAGGMRVSTVSIDVNFFASAPGKGVTAYSYNLARRKELYFNRVDILADDGTIVACGSVIYRIVIPE
ncbi:MAG TPA: PaaI family thioesterase [Candidatus Binataceae bacterium]|nr:PaaI family thioesterase [Candidatus Binataceae bacterium]